MLTKFFLAAVGVAVLAFETGCTTNRVDLVDVGALTVERADSVGVLPAPQAWAEGSELIVRGISTRRSTMHNAPDCVRIVALSPDGTELYSQQAGVYRAHRSHGASVGSGRGSRYLAHTTRYSARFPQVPPKGAVVGLEQCRETRACGVAPPRHSSDGVL